MTPLTKGEEKLKCGIYKLEYFQSVYTGNKSQDGHYTGKAIPEVDTVDTGGEQPQGRRRSAATRHWKRQGTVAYLKKTITSGFIRKLGEAY